MSRARRSTSEAQCYAAEPGALRATAFGMVPGSAEQRYALHRVWDKSNYSPATSACTENIFASSVHDAFGVQPEPRAKAVKRSRLYL